MNVKTKIYRDRYYAKHKEEIKEKNRLRDLRDPERLKRRKRRSHLKIYGLTLDQYYQMYSTQKGKCAICGISSENFNIDHNHTTGKPRGLLCHWCNLGIGHLRDDINLVRKAVEYLEQYQ